MFTLKFDLKKNLLKHFTRNAGFTLLEMLVVFSIMGILAGGGFASYVSYSKKQVLDQAAADLKTGIDQAKFNAVSRVKPTVSPCGPNAPLSKYRIRICSGTVTCVDNANLYEIDAACMVGDSSMWTPVLVSKKRPASLSTTIGTGGTDGCGVSGGSGLEFSVLSGTYAPCKIVLSDGTAYKTVCVDGGGNSSLKDGAVSCGSAYLPTTPTPTLPPITLIPTATPLPSPPLIKTQAGTSSVVSGAVVNKLNSTGNPSGGDTKITYRWDTSSSTGKCSDLCPTGTCTAQSSYATDPAGLFNDWNDATTVPGLIGNTNYFLCATADNTSAGGGLTLGIGQGDTAANNYANLLTVPDKPTVTSVGSPSVNPPWSLTVNWTAPANGVGWYDVYYCDRTSDSTCDPRNQPVSNRVNTSNISSSATSYVVSSLTCNRSYAFTVKGVNTTGSSIGADLVPAVSTTYCAAPAVTTGTPTVLNSSQVQLNSTVNPNNATTTVKYVYGTSSTATTCPQLESAPGSTTVTYATPLNGSTAQSAPYTVTLPAGTNYYYCAYATNTTVGFNRTDGLIVPVSICYRDADGDTYGSSSGPYATCTTSGYVRNNNDCNDANASIILGSTRTMYQAQGVACGTACASQTQTCGAGGVWTGSYTATSCTASTRTAYAALTTSCGVYGNNSQSQTCQTSGAWTGTYTQTSPSAISTGYGYSASSVPCGYTCAGGSKTCTSAGWSPNYPYSSCSVAPGSTYYRDLDGDGYGNSNSGTMSACSTPAGYSALSNDCCDGSSYVYPGSGYWGIYQTACATGGGWDYNCSNSSTFVGSGYRCTTAQAYNYFPYNCGGSNAACGATTTCGGQNEAACPSGGAYYFVCQ
ncbi:MAG: fibronectin type III domain-containing protein [Candidatus Levyibacteriota bacterium]